MDTDATKSLAEIKNTKTVRRQLKSRRGFFYQAVIVGLGSILGLSYLDKKLNTKAAATFYSKRRRAEQPTRLANREPGFYISEKKDGKVLYYLIRHEVNKGAVNPAFKTIPVKRFSQFVNQLKPITTNAAIDIVGKSGVQLLHPVWVVSSLFSITQKTQTNSQLRTLIERLLVYNVVDDPKSKKYLIDLSVKLVEREHLTSGNLQNGNKAKLALIREIKEKERKRLSEISFQNKLLNKNSKFIKEAN